LKVFLKFGIHVIGKLQFFVQEIKKEVVTKEMWLQSTVKKKNLSAFWVQLLLLWMIPPCLKARKVHNRQFSKTRWVNEQNDTTAGSNEDMY